MTGQGSSTIAAERPATDSDRRFMAAAIRYAQRHVGRTATNPSVATLIVRDDGSAGVMETEAYGEAGISPAYATQSGPMLVIGGALHPRFLPDGTSKYIRNGVGVRADGTVVFAITRDPVSLGSFGRLFRDVAECPDALFFDGAVSSLAWGNHMEIDAGEPAGPVVAVFRKQDD